MVKDSVREAAAAFACQIGSLSNDPDVRDTLLKTAVREVSWRLLDEFGDHYALAEQLQIMSELAWRGADAFWAAGIANTPAHSGSRATTRHRPDPVVAADSLSLAQKLEPMQHERKRAS